MTIKHKVITLSSEKEYLGRRDPASKKILKPGDVVTICRSKESPSVFLTSNLPTYENKCPFCGELLSTEKLPKPVASPARSKNKKAVEPAYAATIEEDRRIRGGFASLGVGALVVIAFLCIASLWAFFAFTGRGTPAAPYPTQKASPTQRTSPTQRATSTPRPSYTSTPIPTKTNTPMSASYLSGIYTKTVEPPKQPIPSGYKCADREQLYLSVGQWARTANAGMGIYEEYLDNWGNSSVAPIRALPIKERILVFGGPVCSADGHSWWFVKTESSQFGWVIEYLRGGYGHFFNPIQ